VLSAGPAGLGSTPLTVTGISALPRGRRSRLSRDLHDGVGQSLTTLLVEIRVAIERGHATRDDLLILEREAENALNSVRAVAYRVRARADQVDPIGRAQRYAERLVAVPGATLRWIDDRMTGRLAPQVAKEVAWSIRESVTNAINHGIAGLIEVRLLESEGRLRVTIRDDGVGFEPETLHATPEGRGLGLLGNAERMAEIGGTFTIRSRPGEGAVVILEAPRFPRRSGADATAQTSMAQLFDPQHWPLTAAAGE
jgi:two-component system, NarL family, sensor histidine kinase DevS